MRYIYSDPHYYHTNIIKYESRNYFNVETMNEDLIEKHNSLVGKKDKVYILGDFCLSNKEKTEAIVQRLNGYKILLMGNHDRARSRKWWLETGFDEVLVHPFIIDDFFILSHEPMHMSKCMPYMNLHGHIHSNKLNEDLYYNVCLDNHGMWPLGLDELIDKFKTKSGGEDVAS